MGVQHKHHTWLCSWLLAWYTNWLWSMAICGCLQLTVNIRCTKETKKSSHKKKPLWLVIWFVSRWNIHLVLLLLRCFTWLPRWILQSLRGYNTLILGTNIIGGSAKILRHVSNKKWSPQHVHVHAKVSR